MLILGFDPGLDKTGFGLISAGTEDTKDTKDTKKTPPRYIASGIISCKKNDSMTKRLTEYSSCFDELIAKHKPDCYAVEDVFVGPHAQAALRLGMVYGVLLNRLGTSGLDVFVYAPTKVKQNITGNGHATKETLAQMTYRHLGITANLSHHAADALAIALCHFYESQFAKKING